MKHLKFFGLLVILSLLTAGCEILPYIISPMLDEPSTEPTPIITQTSVPEVIKPTPTSLFTATLPLPTEMVEATEIPEVNSPTPIPSAQYEMQPGNPIYLPNFNHPEADCAWMGVAGQVFDAQGQEVLGLIIRSGELSTITGEFPAYGPGGYEIQLASNPTNTNDVYWVQVFNESGQPISNPVNFSTYETCDQNLILINFIAAEIETPLEPTPTMEAYP